MDPIRVAIGQSTVEDIVTREEAAAILRIHVSTLDRWHAQGVGPRRYQPTGKRGKAFYNRAEVIASALGQGGAR
jgi:hypothetical protein